MRFLVQTNFLAVGLLMAVLKHMHPVSDVAKLYLVAHLVNRSDKLRWMCALTPNRRTRFMSTSTHQTGETECHTNTVSIKLWTCSDPRSLWVLLDSPQVQCIQSYSSQESDELSIEMADVLNLLERTDDGA